MNHEEWNYLADSPDHDLFYHLLNVISPFHVIKSRRCGVLRLLQCVVVLRNVETFEVCDIAVLVQRLLL